MKHFLVLLFVCCAFRPMAQQVRDTIPIDEETRNHHRVFTREEHDPVYAAGPDAWNRDIQQAISRDSVHIARDRRRSRGTCEIRFIVWYDGTLGNIEVLSMQDSRLAETLVKFLRQSKWQPAVQNGRVVNAFHNVKVSYP